MSVALDSLHQSLAHLRTMTAQATDFRVIPFDLPELDDRLHGGLRAGALHEASALGCSIVDDAAATLFLAGVAAREARFGGGPVLWASCRNDLYAPGLEQAGLASADVIYAQPRDDAALLAVGMLAICLLVFWWALGVQFPLFAWMEPWSQHGASSWWRRMLTCRYCSCGADVDASMIRLPSHRPPGQGGGSPALRLNAS